MGNWIETIGYFILALIFSIVNFTTILALGSTAIYFTEITLRSILLGLILAIIMLIVLFLLFLYYRKMRKIFKTFNTQGNFLIKLFAFLVAPVSYYIIYVQEGMTYGGLWIAISAFVIPFIMDYFAEKIQGF